MAGERTEDNRPDRRAQQLEDDPRHPPPAEGGKGHGQGGQSGQLQNGQNSQGADAERDRGLT